MASRRPSPLRPGDEVAPGTPGSPAAHLRKIKRRHQKQEEHLEAVERSAPGAAAHQPKPASLARSSTGLMDDSPGKSGKGKKKGKAAQMFKGGGGLLVGGPEAGGRGDIEDEHRYMDAISLSSHTRSSPLAQSGAPWSMLLMQPVAVPDLSHTGVESAMSPPDHRKFSRYPRVSPTASGRMALRESIVKGIRGKTTKARSNEARYGRGLDPVSPSAGRPSTAPVETGNWYPPPDESLHVGGDPRQFGESAIDVAEIMGKKKHPRVPPAKLARKRAGGSRSRSPAGRGGGDRGMDGRPMTTAGAGGHGGARGAAGDDFGVRPHTTAADGRHLPDDEDPSGGLDFSMEYDAGGDQSGAPPVSGRDLDGGADTPVDSVDAEMAEAEAAAEAEVARLEARRAENKDALKAARSDQMTREMFGEGGVDEEQQRRIAKLQALQRGKRDRKRVSDIKSQREREAHAERERKAREAEEAKEREAALAKLQAIQRGRRDRKRVTQVKKQRETERVAKEMADDPEKAAAMAKLQAMQRGRRDRKRVAQVKKQRETERVAKEMADDPEKAAAMAKLQAMQRGRRDRKRVAQVRRERETAKMVDTRAVDAEREQALAKLQAMQRGRRERQRLKASRGGARSSSSGVDEDGSDAGSSGSRRSLRRGNSMGPKAFSRGSSRRLTKLPVGSERHVGGGGGTGAHGRKMQRMASIRIQSLMRMKLARKSFAGTKAAREREMANMELGAACKALGALSKADINDIIAMCGEDAKLRTKTVAIMSSLFSLAGKEFNWGDAKHFMDDRGVLRLLVMSAPRTVPRETIEKVSRLVHGHHLEAVATDAGAGPLKVMALYLVKFVHVAVLVRDDLAHWRNNT